MLNLKFLRLYATDVSVTEITSEDDAFDLQRVVGTTLFNAMFASSHPISGSASNYLCHPSQIYEDFLELLDLRIFSEMFKFLCDSCF